MLKSWWALLLLLSGTLSYAAQPVSKPQESYAPYWTSEPGWITELQLKNNLPTAPLTVTPVLRLASGRQIVFDPTTIPPNTSVSVLVNQGLLDHASDLFGQPGSYGSVVFRYTSPNAANLYAAVLLSIHGEPISFPIRARPESELANATVGNSLEGIWWQPGSAVNDVLVIGNHSDAKVSGTLGLFDASGKSWRQTLSLGPHESQRMATSDLVKKAGLTGAYGGISFVTEKPISAIDVAHFVYDEVSKFSASEELTHRDPNATLMLRAGPEAKHWTIYAPTLALASPDPALRLPRGTVLQPTLFIRNTTAKNVDADLSLTWRSDSAKGQVKLPQLHLAPFATQQMQIGTMESLLRIPNDAHWGLVTLTTDALPDDLVAVATSTDSSGRYNLPTRFVGGTGGHFTGGEWRIDANHNQISAVTNIGSKPTKTLLTLHYDNGQKSYELQQTIAPGDQMWVNLAQLVRDRVADRNGKTLSIDIGAVTYDLRDLAPGLGNLNVGGLALDDTFGFSVAPPPCPTCCTFSNVSFDPGSVDLVVGTADSVGIDGTNSCTNGDSVLTPDFNSWGSDNVSVAKASYALVEGIAQGSTTAYASGFVNGPGECACSPVFVEPTLPVTVPNNTPILTGIDPSDWPSGATTPSVTFSGQYFGTNAPTLTFSPSSGIGYSLVSYNDTQIVANITVASGTPAEEVEVSVTNNGYGGVGFQNGGGTTSPTSAPVYATVRTLLNNTDEITVIAWVNGSAPDLNPLPSGANSSLVTSLNQGPASCAAQVIDWTVGIRSNISTTADVNYTNAWLVKNSANSAPPATITPSAQYTAGNYRLFNDFGDGKKSYNVGITPDPCSTGFIPGWVAKGQPSQYMGATATSASGELYQLAEGRIGTIGQAGSETINGRTVPWIWSAIEFDSNGNPKYSDTAMFPTYSVYKNGLLVATYPQSSVANFTANDQTYQRTPSQIE